jgi:hypothetical protein
MASVYLVIKEWHIHRPGELLVKVGIDSRGVPFPLPPPFVRLAPIPLPVIPLPLLGRVPPCQPALRPGPKPYPKGAESLLALDIRLPLPRFPPPAPLPGPETSSAPEELGWLSFEVRCRFALPRPSTTSPASKGSIETAPGLGGKGVDVADSALELGYAIC